jgi:hypothetical protein
MLAEAPQSKIPQSLSKSTSRFAGATWSGHMFAMSIGKRLEVFACLPTSPGMTAPGYFLGQAGISARARAIAGESSGPVELSVNAQP